MTREDLKNYGADITPMEMYDALTEAQAYFNGTDKIPNIMPTLNCLKYVVKRELDLDAQLMERYKDMR